MKHKFFKFQNFPITSTPHCSTPPPCVQTRRNHVRSNSTRSKLATRLFGKLKEKKKKKEKKKRKTRGATKVLRETDPKGPGAKDRPSWSAVVA